LATGSAEANQLVPCGDDVIDYRLQLLDFHDWTRYIFQIKFIHIDCFQKCKTSAGLMN